MDEWYGVWWVVEDYVLFGRPDENRDPLYTGSLHGYSPEVDGELGFRHYGLRSIPSQGFLYARDGFFSTNVCG